MPPLRKSPGLVLHASQIDIAKTYNHKDLGVLRVLSVTEYAEGKVEIHAIAKGRHVTLNSIVGLSELVQPVVQDVNKQALMDLFTSVGSNLFILARAGCGKTTTLIGGLKQMAGLKNPFHPSPQQEAIWKEFSKYGKLKSCYLTSFGSATVKELEGKIADEGLQSLVHAKTLHGIGLAAIMSAGLKPKHLELDAYIQPNKVDDIARKYFLEKGRLPKRHFETVSQISSLVGLLKQHQLAPTQANINMLNERYNVGLKCPNYHYVNLAFDESLNTDTIDFNDMIDVVLRNDLFVPKKEMAVGDEAQDLNRAQQLLFKRLADTYIVAGDDRQAIFGFAGADTRSMETLRTMMTGQGDTKVMPLTFTRRCGKEIVRLAQEIVPDIEAFDTNHNGCVKHEPGWALDRAVQTVHPGDFFLSRMNAPLFKGCLQLLKGGKQRGYIVNKGGLAKSLKNILHSLDNDTGGSKVLSLDGRLSAFAEENKDNPSMMDKVDCLQSLLEASSITATVDDLCKTIDRLSEPSPDSVKFSTIHTAKGMEAKRVIFFRDRQAPCPMYKDDEEEMQQEWNLTYVAETRAIEELVVTGMAIQAPYSKPSNDGLWKGPQGPIGSLPLNFFNSWKDE